MLNTRRTLTLLAAMWLPVCGCTRGASPPDPAYVQEVEAWRKGHEES